MRLSLSDGYAPSPLSGGAGQGIGAPIDGDDGDGGVGVGGGGGDGGPRALAGAPPPSLSAPVASRVELNKAGKPKQKRYRASPDQLAELVTVFTVTASPAAEVLSALAARIGMPLQSVVLWFKNRRARVPNKGAKGGGSSGGAGGGGGTIGSSACSAGPSGEGPSAGLALLSPTPSDGVPLQAADPAGFGVSQHPVALVPSEGPPAAAHVLAAGDYQSATAAAQEAAAAALAEAGLGVGGTGLSSLHFHSGAVPMDLGGCGMMMREGAPPPVGPSVGVGDVDIGEAGQPVAYPNTAAPPAAPAAAAPALQASGLSLAADGSVGGGAAASPSKSATRPGKRTRKGPPLPPGGPGAAAVAAVAAAASTAALPTVVRDSSTAGATGGGDSGLGSGDGGGSDVYADVVLCVGGQAPVGAAPGLMAAAHPGLSLPVPPPKRARTSRAGKGKAIKAAAAAKVAASAAASNMPVTPALGLADPPAGPTPPSGAAADTAFGNLPAFDGPAAPSGPPTGRGTALRALPSLALPAVSSVGGQLAGRDFWQASPSGPGGGGGDGGWGGRAALAPFRGASGGAAAAGRSPSRSRAGGRLLARSPTLRAGGFSPGLRFSPRLRNLALLSAAADSTSRGLTAPAGGWEAASPPPRGRGVGSGPRSSPRLRERALATAATGGGVPGGAPPVAVLSLGIGAAGGVHFEGAGRAPTSAARVPPTPRISSQREYATGDVVEVLEAGRIAGRAWAPAVVVSRVSTEVPFSLGSSVHVRPAGKESSPSPSPSSPGGGLIESDGAGDAKGGSAHALGDARRVAVGGGGAGGRTSGARSDYEDTDVTAPTAAAAAAGGSGTKPAAASSPRRSTRSLRRSVSFADAVASSGRRSFAGPAASPDVDVDAEDAAAAAAAEPPTDGDGGDVSAAARTLVRVARQRRRGSTAVSPGLPPTASSTPQAARISYRVSYTVAVGDGVTDGTNADGGEIVPASRLRPAPPAAAAHLGRRWAPEIGHAVEARTGASWLVGVVRGAAPRKGFLVSTDGREAGWVSRVALRPFLIWRGGDEWVLKTKPPMALARRAAAAAPVPDVAGPSRGEDGQDDDGLGTAKDAEASLRSMEEDEDVPAAAALIVDTNRRASAAAAAVSSIEAARPSAASPRHQRRAAKLAAENGAVEVPDTPATRTRRRRAAATPDSGASVSPATGSVSAAAATAGTSSAALVDDGSTSTAAAAGAPSRVSTRRRREAVARAGAAAAGDASSPTASADAVADGGDGAATRRDIFRRTSPRQRGSEAAGAAGRVMPSSDIRLRMHG